MSLSKIKVLKSQLLDIVKDNKKKHDEIYDAAEAGYWLEAKEFLQKYQKDQLALMKKNYLKDVKLVKNQIAKESKMVEQKKKDGYSYMRKPFPENHSDDYKGTIQRLELSIEPEIELETGEFDWYVRNKWEWRAKFLSTNTSYANNYCIISSYSSYSSTGSFGIGCKSPTDPLQVGASWVSGSVLESIANF